MVRFTQSTILLVCLVTTSQLETSGAFSSTILARVPRARLSLIGDGMTRHNFDLAMAKKKKNGTNGDGSGADPAARVVEKQAAPVAKAPVEGNDEGKEVAQPPAPAQAVAANEQPSAPPVSAPTPPKKQAVLDLRNQPLSAADEAKVAAKYGAIKDTGEKAFAILVDLGLVELHG